MVDMLSWQRLLLIGCAGLFLPFAGWSAALSVEATRAGALADLKLLIDTAKSAWAYAEDKQQHFGVDLDLLRETAAVSIGTCTN